MPNVELCRDILCVQIATQAGSDELYFTVEDPSTGRHARFACHVDELLATTYGLSFHAGGPEGHVHIESRGNDIAVRFSLVEGPSQVCLFPTTRFRETLQELRNPRPRSVS